MTKVGAVEAEDLIQSTFAGCLEGADRFRGESGFRAFLMGVARFTLLRFFDSKRRDARFDPLTYSMADSGVSAPAIVERDEQRRILLGALRTLPLDDQIAIELYYWEGYGLAQVGEVLGLSTTATKSRIFRARKVLATRVRSIESGAVSIQSTVDNLERWRERVQEQEPGEAGSPAEGE